MLAADQEKALAQLAKKKAARRSAAQVRQQVSKTFEHITKSMTGPSFKKAVAARKEKEKLLAAAAKQRSADIKRVYADIGNNVDRAVKLGVPGNVRVWTDDKNGRWKLTYSTVFASAARSVSWTAIGQKRAAAEAVRQGWSWASTFEGIESSPESVELLRRLGG
jgi:histidinol phosphatase-like enzyme